MLYQIFRFDVSQPRFLSSSTSFSSPSLLGASLRLLYITFIILMYLFFSLKILLASAGWRFIKEMCQVLSPPRPLPPPQLPKRKRLLEISRKNIHKKRLSDGRLRRKSSPTSIRPRPWRPGDFFSSSKSWRPSTTTSATATSSSTTGSRCISCNMVADCKRGNTGPLSPLVTFSLPRRKLRPFLSSNDTI